MAVFEFDVEVSTHAALRAGVVAVSLVGTGPDSVCWHRVVVEAETHEDAALLAAQLGSLVPPSMLPRFPLDFEPVVLEDGTVLDPGPPKAIICAIYPRW